MLYDFSVCLFSGFKPPNIVNVFNKTQWFYALKHNNIIKNTWREIKVQGQEEPATKSSDIN